jgi:site-specific DNA-methyltransferase (cytosine-N4-specific)
LPNENRNCTVSIRFTEKEKQTLEQTAQGLGFKSISDYLRHLHNEKIKNAHIPIEYDPPERSVEVFHKTKNGTIYCGDSLDYLFNVAEENSVDLIMTSPPFGLVRKKSYGNEDSDKYCDWFRPFAEGFKRVLKDQGSLVIDIRGAWKKGYPTRSLYHFDLLIMLCKEFGFHLCQEHYWWNPSKLPTPAEWVNIRRVRVKDAVNCVWWLSKTPYPRANNREILAPYSDSMRDLLKNGYVAKERPSGHKISKKFSRDNGGSVPPNLLAIANTESNGSYLNYCREHNLEIHPARFPAQLPEYFIKFLTNPGDFVLDPFAGSCVTGMVADNLDRKWACVELNAGFLQGAVSRFHDKGEQPEGEKSNASQYQIWAPCAVDIDESEIRVVEDGGLTRPASNKAN